MSPNLYDLLDVDESATPEEIRAAWKSAIADLDPTDRRFRAYNDAAAVLLDEDKRAAYDATLAEARVEEEAGTDVPVTAGVTATAAEDEPLAVKARRDAAATEEATAAGADDAPAGAEAGDAQPTDVPPSDTPVTGTPATGTPATGTPATDTPATDTPATDTPATDEPARVVPGWALIAAAVAAVLSIALLVWVITWPGTTGESPKAKQEAADQAIEDVAGVAEEMVPVVFAYDHRTYDADVAAAREYFTPEFGEKQGALLAELKPEVLNDKVSVSSVVSSTGVTRVSEDGDRAHVVVFVDQSSQKGNAAPQPLRLWATLVLERADEGWLLDDICIQTECA